MEIERPEEWDLLRIRTDDACAQLTRYGGEVCGHELADVLSEIVDINDDMHHMRAKDIIRARIEQAKTLLDVLMAHIDAEDWP